MKKINIGKNIARLRQKAGMTQDRLAEYAGVSKSAVSKWENSMTYPDIVLLPELATLFNISVDELMGYSPQLTKEAIRRIYDELSAKVAEGKLQEVLDRARKHIKEYYSCFPFLMQMAVFYLNHCTFYENKDELLEEAGGFCRRIQKECDEPALVNDAFYVEATVLTIQNKPTEVLALIGEDVKPFRQDSEMIAGAFQQLGNISKAKEVTQIMIYQYMLLLIGNSASYMMLNLDRLDILEETIRRMSGVIELYQVDRLHLNVAVQFYLTAAAAYCTHNMTGQALDMLERYQKICENSSYTLHGDQYFDQIEPWLKQLNQGVERLRNETIVKQSMLSMVKDNPQFSMLHREKRYQAVVRCLQNI